MSETTPPDELTDETIAELERLYQETEVHCDEHGVPGPSAPSCFQALYTNAPALIRSARLAAEPRRSTRRAIATCVCSTVAVGCLRIPQP